MSDYLEWHSELSLETVFAGSGSIAYPEIWGDGILYAQTLTEEQGRTVIMFRRNGEAECLTPARYNLRSKFNEYGGKPFWLIGDTIYFVNLADQCLYQQPLLVQGKAEPTRVTAKPDDSVMLMYTDVIGVADDKLLAIVERQVAQADDVAENQSFLAAIDLHTFPARVIELRQGADFYSNLCIDSARQSIAWVQWDHPAMPWDETQLWLAELSIQGQDISLAHARRAELPQSASICQLIFANNGKLFFSADFAGQEDDSTKNYWNIYALDPGCTVPAIVQVSHMLQEFGYPHWQYGDARIAQYGPDSLVSFASSSGGDVLYKIDQDSLALTILDARGCGYQNLSATGDGRAVMIRLTVQKPASLVVVGENQEQQMVYSPPSALAPADISVAEHFKFPTRDGEFAYGYYYAPTNQNYQQNPPDAVAPPMIVMVHGGPTAGANRYFDIQKQFWTQRGYAIFDVNHRGSSGYGRAFRDALYGNWGETDTVDIIDGIEYLVAHSKADAKRIVIRGKSAGGYAVLRVLTEFPTVFKAGACYYGIGNLVTLAQTTHKFEKHYTDRMLGEAFDVDHADLPQSLFYQRSPVNHISRLQSAMIVFQGSEDRVVPPAVAHEIIEALKSLGLEHSYVEYPEEGHGFRKAENNIDAWGKELNFYQASLAADKIGNAGI